MPDSAAPCTLCGEAQRISLADAWSDHRFLLETCCEGLHEQMCRDMADDPAWARDLLAALGAEDLLGHRLRRVANDGCGGLALDWRPDLRPVTFTVARAFIARHHAHCGPPVAWRFGVAAWNGPTMLGVGTVGNPVSRAFCGQGIVEVNRLCIRRDVPSALAWNIASQLLGWAAREAARRGFQRIVTYTRADEPGTSLIAAGWTCEARVRGRGWHGRGRARSNRNGWIDKLRWGRVLAPDRKCFAHENKSDTLAAQQRQENPRWT